MSSNTLRQKQRTSVRMAAMNGTRRRFSKNHPFWGEAVSLRREFKSIRAITERAHVLGYRDLSENMISLGLRYATSLEALPERTSNYLQERYSAAIDGFSAENTIKATIIDAIQELHEVDEELIENETLSKQDKEKLKEQRSFLRGQINKWSREYLEQKAELRGSDSVANFAQALSNGATINALEYLDTLIIPELRHLSPPPDPSALIQKYGAENIRFPSLEAQYTTLQVDETDATPVAEDDPSPLH